MILYNLKNTENTNIVTNKVGKWYFGLFIIILNELFTLWNILIIFSVIYNFFYQFKLKPKHSKLMVLKIYM